MLEVSTDEGSYWYVVTPESGYPMTMTGGPLLGYQAFSGTSDGWQYCSVDLESYAGSQVMFRYRFASNASIMDAGWYIDDFGLHEKSGYIAGHCYLAYLPVHPGTTVELVGTGRSTTTNLEGFFCFDSVKIGSGYKVRFSKSGFLPDSISGISVTRFDTTFIERTLSPELSIVISQQVTGASAHHHRVAGNGADQQRL